jgi:hypothetical protein
MLRVVTLKPQSPLQQARGGGQGKNQGFFTFPAGSGNTTAATAINFQGEAFGGGQSAAKSPSAQ